MSKLNEIKKKILEDYFSARANYCGCWEKCDCYEKREGKIEALEQTLYHFGIEGREREKLFEEYRTRREEEMVKFRQKYNRA